MTRMRMMTMLVRALLGIRLGRDVSRREIRKNPSELLEALYLACNNSMDP